jgi:aminoglycoside 3-N-acetyltransferase
MMMRTGLPTAETAALWITALRQLGVERGSCMLFHASFAPLSRRGLLPERVLEAFVGYLDGGTLLAPTLSWREVSPDRPVFDEQATCSNVGILSEVFRTGFAERRSLHPTHSVAGLGPLIGRLLSDHSRDARPCSPQSPWGRLAETNTTVLMINVDMDACTLVHSLEETFDPGRYLRDEVEWYRCVDRSGSSLDVPVRRHRKLHRNFWKFREALQRRNQCRFTELLGSRIFAFKAADLVQVGSDMFEQDRGASLAGDGEPSKLM